MDRYNLTDFKRGWILGNFNPAIINVDYEVGVQSYKANDTSERHIHKLATEINIILDGECVFIPSDINNKLYLVPNDIVVVHPYESVEFKALTDCRLLVIKTTSVPDDKYYVTT